MSKACCGRGQPYILSLYTKLSILIILCIVFTYLVKNKSVTPAVIAQDKEKDDCKTVPKEEKLERSQH